MTNHVPEQSSSSSSAINPQEEALQSLCKQILKSRFFRGFYMERVHVEIANGYRDIVALHRGEREFEKLLLDIKQKLQLFYQGMWIGITHGQLLAAPVLSNILSTYLWVELVDVAFGQYWFYVKTVRFREHEIIVKLKMIRPVENETPEPLTLRRVSSISQAPAITNAPSTPFNKCSENDASTQVVVEPQIGVQDFVGVVQHWGRDIKHTVFDFMSNDINKDNIKGLLQFLGLVVISILSGTIVAIKFLGIFILRFLFEFSRLTHILTPIILKLIDVFNKIVGGFYLLLAMIWRDTVGNRPNKNQRASVGYRSPLTASPMKMIEYNVRSSPRKSSQIYAPESEFERKSQ